MQCRVRDPTFFSCYWCKNTQTHSGLLKNLRKRLTAALLENNCTVLYLLKGQIKPKTGLASRRFSEKTNKRIWFVCCEKQKSKQNKFVRLFFGRIYGAQICFRFYLTFIDYYNLRLAHDQKPFLPIATVGLDRFLRASLDIYVSSVKRKQKHSLWFSELLNKTSGYL